MQFQAVRGILGGRGVNLFLKSFLWVIVSQLMTRLVLVIPTPSISEFLECMDMEIWRMLNPAPSSLSLDTATLITLSQFLYLLEYKITLFNNIVVSQG